jgi:alkanesulfonate monooxygenase SsuD/methylene tetrahydromethanopterin reductase-like flavin-dependent oxidoreductase (luciferase family)
MTAAPPVPLGVLDLVPVVAGSDARTAVCHAMDLVEVAEQLGYHRYWFAEHHLNPGVAGTAPALLIAMAGAVTETIRLGSGGVQSGHRTALSVVEEFGLLDAMHPGRVDLGLGRSGDKSFFKKRLARPAPGPDGAPPRPVGDRVVGHVLVPSAPSLRHLADAPRLALTAEMLQQEGARASDYTELVDTLLGLIDGTYRSAAGLDPHPVPGTGATVEPWILGSSAGESAELAGRRGLRFAASYHISPSSALDAAEAYRQAFIPSSNLDRPYVAVSADVVVAPDDETAERLAAGYALWVRSIRCGEGAIAFPGPNEAARHPLSDEDRALVRDRVATQFVGSPSTVVGRLRDLQEVTQADELIITTITHSHTDRVRSYALLAHEWFGGATKRAPRSRLGVGAPS